MACLPNAIYLETGGLGPDSPLQIENGHVSLPTGPGFSWRPESGGAVRGAAITG